MSLEIRPEEFLSFADWFGPAFWGCIVAIPVLTALAIFVCYLISAARRGPVEGFYSVAGVIASAIGRDLPATSVGRVLAMTRLTIKEAIRRKVLVGFILFVIIFLFAGWFLDVKSDDPAHLYLSFVLTTTNYLVIMLALFLATVSLPSDIKSKVMYTIVTKPVRAGEIILGRVFGFVAVISALLIAMCFISYMFVERGLDHDHDVMPDSVASIAPPTDGEASPGWEGQTTMQSHHRHTWRVDRNGKGATDEVAGHTHPVERVDSGDGEASYVIGPPQGALEARVPIFGKLRFLNRDGEPVDKGISVGKEWEYRSYIEGRTHATAIWRFEDVGPEDFEDIWKAEGLEEDEFDQGYLPIAMTLSVFRTYKADIETGVRGVIIINGTDERTQLQCEPIGFESKEFATQQFRIPRKLRALATDGSSGREIDLFDDLIVDGNLEIWIRCDDPVQYFGMAQADLYLEAPLASFQWNFVKAYISIWLQMVIVVCLGVMFSAFLSSPVAILATLSAVILGFFGQFVQGLWTGKEFGGGPIEALIRLIGQDNLTSPLEFGAGAVGVWIVKFIDKILLTIMAAMSGVLPNFSSLGRAAEYVAYNFNFYDQLLVRQCLATFVYATAITIVGYFFLKTREIAA